MTHRMHLKSPELFDPLTLAALRFGQALLTAALNEAEVGGHAACCMDMFALLRHALNYSCWRLFDRIGAYLQHDDARPQLDGYAEAEVQLLQALQANWVQTPPVEGEKAVQGKVDWDSTADALT